MIALIRIFVSSLNIIGELFFKYVMQLGGSAGSLGLFQSSTSLRHLFIR